MKLLLFGMIVTAMIIIIINFISCGYHHHNSPLFDLYALLLLLLYC